MQAAHIAPLLVAGAADKLPCTSTGIQSGSLQQTHCTVVGVAPDICDGRFLRSEQTDECELGRGVGGSDDVPCWRGHDVLLWDALPAGAQPTCAFVSLRMLSCAVLVSTLR